VIQLRAYQALDTAAIRTEYKRGARAVLYVAPTGSGKGVLFTYIASEMAKRGKRAWILLHRQELLSQTSRNLTAFGVDHGLVAPQYTMDQRALLQVASINTMSRRLDKFAPPDLIIADEAHHAISPSWREVIDAHPQSKVLGTSATPERLDGRGLSELFQRMVIGPTVQELTNSGFLAPATVYAPPQLLDMTGVAKRGGDYAKDQMAERVDEPTITGDAVAHYARICPGVPAIAFCASVLHAEHVTAQFKDTGFRSVSVDGSTDDRERRRRIDGLSSGQVQVLTSCDLVSEGLDVPGVTAAILLRPTQSLALARQQIGRALRPAPGKRAIILDHVGNIPRHGLPTEEIEWSLEGGAAKKRGEAEKTLRLRQCPTCYRVHTPGPTCPECGHAYESAPRTVKQIEGELQEVTEIESFRRKAAMQREVQEAKTLDQLIAIGKARKYKSPLFWAKYVLQGRRAKQRASA
jgi:DNA repair protein RadD